MIDKTLTSEIIDKLILDHTSGKVSTVKAMGWGTSMSILLLGCFLLCLVRGHCLFCIPQCIKNWNTNRLDRIHAENLRTCVQRDYWYQMALGRLRQRGQGTQEHVEGASVEGASEEGASAPQRETPPPLPSKPSQPVSKPIDIKS